MSWQLPSGAPAASDWTMPAKAIDAATVTSGPAGVVIGHHRGQPISLSLFNLRPVRMALAVHDEHRLLLILRAAALGAHVSLITDEPGRWRAAVEPIVADGGTVDLVTSATRVPGAGRAYRPSLIINDSANFDVYKQLGSWQGLINVVDVRTDRADAVLRSGQLSMVSVYDDRGLERLKRAYALSSRQLRLAENLDRTDVLLATARRLVRCAMVPTATEHGMLGGPVTPVTRWN